MNSRNPRCVVQSSAKRELGVDLSKLKAVAFGRHASPFRWTALNRFTPQVTSCDVMATLQLFYSYGHTLGSSPAQIQHVLSIFTKCVLFIYFLHYVSLYFLFIYLFFVVYRDFILFFSFIFISWRLITLQYCSGFCHTLTWISHGFTCIPHPDPPLPPLSLPDPSGSSQCTRSEHLSHASNLGWWSISP